jgi:glycosyltransferase involved in cell wall biosynthesis
MRSLDRLLLKLAAPVVPLANRLPRSQRDRMRRLFHKLFVPRAPRLTRDTSQPLRGLPGVNLFGLLDSASGVGEGARAAVRALEAAKIPHVAICLESSQLFQGKPLEAFDAPYSVNLFHLNADVIDFGISAVGTDLLVQRINIASWAWELESFPADWNHLFSTLDEIWVCSKFVQQAVAQQATVPVFTIPYPISVPQGIKAQRSEFGIPNNRPVVLSAFDVASYPERKNPWGCIDAFTKVLDHPSRPVLVLKIGSGNVQPEIKRGLQDRLDKTDLILIDEQLSRDGIWRLLDCCDVFLSLHRSEGFGLLLAEAMALGKPVVATGYSGNMDFMNSSNSFPVRYDMQTLQCDIGPYKQGNRWADPDAEHAAMHLQQVLDLYPATQPCSRRATEDISERLSPAAVGSSIRDRLVALGVLRSE